MNFNNILSFIVLVLLPITLLSNVYSYSDENSGTIGLLTVSEQNNTERGGIANLRLDVRPGSGRIFIDSFPLSKLDTQITMRFASEVACELLEKDCSNYDFFYTITASSAVVGGPSAGAAATVLTVAVLDGQELYNNTIMTGTINSGNLIGPVAGIPAKTLAAQLHGYKNVIIPKWDNVNNTPDENLSINIFRVSTLEDALYYFTGKNYSKEDDIYLDNKEYTKDYDLLMRDVTIELCTKYGDKSLDNNPDEQNFPKLSDYDINITNSSQDNFKLASDALNSGSYYSAASFCFGGNVKVSNSILSKYNKNQLKLEYVKLMNNISEFEKELNFKSSTINSISELESYMIVSERLSESKKILRSMNPENISVAQLAYAIERFNTALIWLKFYDLPGQEFVMNNELLKVVCSKKLSEAEERLNYLEIYYPSKELREDLNLAYAYYAEDNYALCIYTSSKIKADSNVVLSVIFISENDTSKLFDEKINVAKRVMSKQAKNGVFPIIGYSYYEYANTLSKTDTYSALVYAEYALELSNLDMYFDNKEKLQLTKISYDNRIFFFISGIIIGIAISLIFVIIYIKNYIKKSNNFSKNTSHKKTIRKK